MSNYLNEQKLLVNQIQRIHPLDISNNYHKLFAFVGMLRKRYGYDNTLKTLITLKEKSSVPYIVGACKKELANIKLMEIE